MRLREARAAARALLPPPPPYVPPLEKACTHCGVVKPLDAFRAHKQTRDKKNSWCNPCMNAAGSVATTTKRYTDPAWRAESAEKKRAARRAANPTLLQRDALRADHRAHVDAFRSWLGTLAQADAHVVTYRAFLASQSPEHRPYTPKQRAYERCKSAWRRARRKGGRSPGVRCKDLLPFYEYAVWLEGETGIEWNVDHIVPYASGGWHRPDNLQVLPRAINEAKGVNSVSPIGIPTKRDLESVWLP